MRTVEVDLKENTYPIMIGHGTLPSLGQNLEDLGLGQDAVVITNPVVNRLHGKALAAGLKKAGFSVQAFIVPDGEKSKSVRTAFDLFQKIARYDVRKKIFIVAFGGGVIGDLAGYVAAAYKRGIPYIQVPTTLLAQIDSAIGGKVAVDLPVGKNLVGAFYQPKLVFSDTAVLQTLTRRQIRNGLAEAVKYGVICDEQFFHFLEANVDNLLALDVPAMTEVVLACSRIKASVVSADEKETKGIRTILNFGHTAGHAVEAAAGFSRYHHGEAVALGMRVALELSCRMNLLPPPSARRVEDLLTAVGLPERIRGVTLPRIMKHMAHDKKFSGKTKKFVLAAKIGSVKVVEGLPEAVIRSAVRKYLRQS
ncbi:MAG: 3-dehydroquinate synthase [Candidatus Omnitrophota bacterium]|nr:3-dehydroquinate synthase [Candidatus Omnitrophota bacterium]MDZ4242321.1 3-dehydroquinate synthase [Candidatus Omnitrophota bacterium]